MAMKIFIPSWRRPDTTTTPALLQACGITNFKVVVRENEYTAYSRNFKKSNLLVIGKNDDLTVARETTRQTLRKNEWCLHMDDNVLGFIAPTQEFYSAYECVPLRKNEKMVTRAKWQRFMNVPLTFAEFYAQVIVDTLEQAEERGAYLCGFSAHDNPAFRYRKFTDVGYVCGKTMLMRNQGLPWKQSRVSSGEDYALTAAHLYDNGRILVNKWGHPMRKHYQEGGCGPYEERLPDMIRAQQELTSRYENSAGVNLFGIKNANAPEKKQGELRLRFHSLEQVEKWRSVPFHKDPNMR